MTISSFKPGINSTDRTTALLAAQKDQLTNLLTQINSGRVADTFGGLGSQRSTVLDLNAKASQAKGFLDTISTASTRVQLVNTSLTQIAKNVSASNAGNLYSFTFSSNGTVTSQQVASNYLSEAVDALNTGANGEYYFSGRASTTKPVSDLDTILNGDGTHAGVKQLITERKAADLGTGTGRLVISGAGTAVSLSEESAGLPFGIKLNTAPVNGLTNVAATGPSSGTIGVTFNGLPNSGEAITLKLSLPDGTTTDLSLTATTVSPPPAGQFTIGPDAATTTANFQTALTSSIGTVATTTLASASALKGASDFYAGSVSNPPARIAPPFATATGFLTPAQAAATTVTWYQGDDDTSVAARDTSAQRIDSSQVVGIGARANESALQTALAQWTVLSTESFSASTPNDALRYQALATRVQANFTGQPGSQSVQDISGEIAIANTAIAASKDRNTQKLSYLTGASDDITATDPTKVLTEINTLQTQLQASYQVTGTLGQLSLVNFLK